MSLLERVITAHRCRSTHHYIAIDALSQISGPDAEKWKNLLLLHNHELLQGAKAPDAKFKDFKNHVLHIGEGEWGGARDKAMEWYGEAVDHLRKKKWSKAAYALGVLSHYYADPIQPFHTGQTEEEGSIHRALEWSVAKSRDVIKERIEEKGYPTVAAGEGIGFVSDMVRAGAEQSHPHYQTLLDHYNIDAGVKNPPAGLDQTLIDVFAELVAYATAGLGVLFSRAFKEAGVAAPKVHITVPGYIATLDIPLRWVTQKIDDVNDRHTVEAMYKELKKSGKVIKTLPDDDKAVRKIHARQVLRTPLKVLDAQELRQTGTKHTPRDGFADLSKVDAAPSKKELRAKAKAEAIEAKRAAAENKKLAKAEAKESKAMKGAPDLPGAAVGEAVATVVVKETRADKKAKAQAEKEAAKAAKAEAEAAKRAEKQAKADAERAEREATEEARLAERQAAEAAKKAEMEAAVKAKEEAFAKEDAARQAEEQATNEDTAAEEARKRVAESQEARLKAAEESDRLAQEEIAREETARLAAEEEARLEAEEEERIAQEDERMVAAEAARRKLQEEEAARMKADEAERRAALEADRMAAEAGDDDDDDFEVDAAYYEDENDDGDEDGEAEFSLEELAAFETNLTDNGDLPDDDEDDEVALDVDEEDEAPAIAAPRAAPPVESFFENGAPDGGNGRRGLSIDDPVVDAPSIGKKTAKRLSKLGIETVGDLLECDIEEIAFELDVRHIDEQTLIDWQDQSMLMIDVPGLRVHDAQILVGSGIRSADDLSNASAEKVFRTAMGFLSTPDGARVVRDDHVLDQNEVDDWIGMARDAKAS